LLAFVVLIGLSVPMSAELAAALPDVLPGLGIREGQFGWLVDKYVLDLMVNWPLLALAPMTLLGEFVDSLPDVGTIFLSCAGWAPIALAYTWGTRNRHLYFFVLSIYPFVWVMGIGFQLMAEAAAGL
ncbi:MAG: hypothetical protein PVH89_10910, partial [Gammaproteobacteria bacterium]